jgi:hypothetical protein
MARKRNATTKQSTSAIPEQVTSGSFQNLGIQWKARPDGSAELRVAYDGRLASRDEVIARAGTWREGSAPWGETRELRLHREGARWVGTIPVAAGTKVQAIEFVFRAHDEWDNGGRAPLGYYEWNPHERRVEVR